MGESIGLGIIGANNKNMGSTLLLLNDDDNLRFKIIGVCGRNEKRLAGFAGENGIPYWTTDYQALVAHESIDVVAIFSPDALHMTHCVAALKAGKHVICTKPMVTNLADAKELVKLVRDHKKKLMVGQTMKFDPQFDALSQLVKGGQLGEIMAAEAFYIHDMREVFMATALQ